MPFKPANFLDLRTFISLKNSAGLGEKVHMDGPTRFKANFEIVLKSVSP